MAHMYRSYMSLLRYCPTTFQFFDRSAEGVQIQVIRMGTWHLTPRLIEEDQVEWVVAEGTDGLIGQWPGVGGPEHKGIAIGNQRQDARFTESLMVGK